MSDCSGDSFDFLSDIDSDGMSHRSESVENLDEGAEMLPSSSFEEEAVEKSACEEETDNSCSTAHDEDEAAEWELMPRKEHEKEVEKLREQIQSERKNNSLILDMIMRETEENEAHIYSQLEEMKTMCEDLEKSFADNKIAMQTLNINLLKELEASNEKCKKLEEENAKLTIEKDELKARDIMRERMLDECNREILRLKDDISILEKQNSLLREISDELQKYEDFFHLEMDDKIMKPLQEALEEQERTVERAVQRVKAAYEGRNLENQNEKIDVYPGADA